MLWMMWILQRYKVGGCVAVSETRKMFWSRRLRGRMGWGPLPSFRANCPEIVHSPQSSLTDPHSSHKLVPVLATDLGQTYKLGCGPGENIFSDVLLCRGNLAKLFVFKSTRFNKNYQPK